VTQSLEEIETRLLLEGLAEHHGYDFRNYSRRALTKRIHLCVREMNAGTISGLQAKILHDSTALQRFLNMVSISVTSMFRMPSFFATFRREVIPFLRTYRFVRVWLAGCSSGEEAYSLAILLHEEGLYERCRIYATDINEASLERAAAGELALGVMQMNTRNYVAAGGREVFSEYYTVVGDRAMTRPYLRRNILFAPHNLVTDGCFNEFHVIWCRNVLIYFDRELQNRVHRLIYESLMRHGVLGLGDRESLDFTPHGANYEPVVAHEKLYRKVA
jgi:chemotaxis protein methyltransferase CheR